MMKASDSIVPTIPLSSISTTSSSAKKKRRYPADTGAKIWVAAMTPWLEGLAINSVYVFGRRHQLNGVENNSLFLKYLELFFVSFF